MMKRTAKRPGRAACLGLALAMCWACTVLGHGVDSGTVITNATLTNQAPDYWFATNAGNLSGVYSNAAKIQYFAVVNAPAARTRVANGYDLSPVIVKSAGTNMASAGMTVYFTNWVTNWGNFTGPVRVRLLKQSATGTWTNAYALLLNGTWVSSNAESANNTLAGVPENGPVSAVIRVTVPLTMADRSSNRFFMVLDDGAVFPGDQWPGKGALSPAVQDTNNRRDYQTNWFVVKVAGPVLDIMKSADITAGIRPYQILTYTIIVTNRGSADAYKVSLRDILPANVTNVIGTVRIWTNSTAMSNAGPFTENLDVDPLTVNGQMVTFGIGTVRPGKASKLKIDVRVR